MSRQNRLPARPPPGTHPGRFLIIIEVPDVVEAWQIEPEPLGEGAVGMEVLRLPTDLKIDVSIQGDSTWIRMSRSTSYPTIDEWAILTKHWPEPIKPYPHREKMFGRCYLAALWHDGPTNLYSFAPGITVSE